jgi:hypothetical protein
MGKIRIHKQVKKLISKQFLKGPSTRYSRAGFLHKSHPYDYWLGDLGTGEKYCNFVSLCLDLKFFVANILLSV